MPVTTFSSVVSAQTVGTADIEKLTASLDKQSAALDNLGKKAEQVKPPAWEKFSTGADVTTKALEATAVAAAGTAVAMSRMGAVTAEQAVVTERVANSFRGLRIALSPTALTVYTLAAGVAIQKTIEWTIARDKIIRQDALLAASYENFQGAYSNLSRLGMTGAIMGMDRAGFQKLFEGVDVGKLSGLVEQFQKLKDPVDQAAFAVEHFGDQAEKALPLLNGRLIESIARGKELADVFDSRMRVSINNMIAPWRDFREQLRGVNTEVLTAIEQIKVWAVVAGATVHETIGTAPTREQMLGLPPTERLPTYADFTKMLPGVTGARRTDMLRGAWTVPGIGSAGAFDAAMGTRASSLEGVSENVSRLHARLSTVLKALETTLPGGSMEAVMRGQAVDILRQISAMEPLLEAAKKAEELRRRANELTQEGQGFYRLGTSAIVSAQEMADANMKGRRVPSLWGLGGPPGGGEGIVEYPLKPGMNYDFGTQGAFVPDFSVQEGIEREMGRAFGQGLLDKLDAEAKDRAAGASADEEIARMGITSARYRTETLSSKQVRLAELAAGPGQEMSGVNAGYQERLKLAHQLYDLEIDRAIAEQDGNKAAVLVARAESDLKHQLFAAEIEHELKIAELQRRRLDELRNRAGEFFDAMLQGPKGIQRFFTDFVKSQARTIFQNIIVEQAKGISPYLGSASKYLTGTLLGTDPLKSSGMVLNSAGMRLQVAAGELIGAARTLAMSSSGGGGGLVNAARMAGFDGGGGGDFIDGYDPGEGVADYPGLSPEERASVRGTLDPGGGGGKGVSGLGRGVKYGMAGIGVGLGVYGAVTSPSTRGKLASAGGGLMSAGAVIPGPAGWVVMGAGAVTSLASMLFGDPKEDRRKELERSQQARAFSDPMGRAYESDLYGRSIDYDYRGGMRVYNDYRSYSAIDAPSFVEWGKRNSAAIAEVTTAAIASGNGEDMVGTLRQVL